jgi:AAA family ATP:ADP antiporter
MFSAVARLLDIRPGEGPQAAKAGMTLFCIIAGHTLLETARDTLFLGSLPPGYLAFVYAAVAVLAALGARWNTALTLRFGVRNTLLLTLIAAAYGGTFFYLVPKTHATVFGLYVYAGLLGSVMVVQFWMLCSTSFTVAQGKRLFGPVSSGGLLGAVSGASAAIVMLRFLTIDKLLLGSTGLFVVAALVLTELETPEAEEPLRKVPRRKRRQRPWNVFKEHPYLGYLAALLAVSTSALLVTDYLFKSAAARAFPARELGEFFAVYYAALNALALLVQLGLSAHLVRRFGVFTAFLMLPTLLLGGGVALVATGGTLALVLATKAADGGLRHSLHRITSELLWLPLPEGVRARSKSFIDTVVVRATQAITAGALVVLAFFGQDDDRTLAGLLCGLLLLWLGLGWGVRRPYLSLFRQALSGTHRGDVRLELDLNAIEIAVEALSSREPQRAVAAIELLAQNRRSRLIPALILYHESEQVLIAGLRAVSTPDRRDWIPLAERLLGHSADPVRVAAMRALANADMLSAIVDGPGDASPRVRGHAAFLIVKHSETQEPLSHPAIVELMSLPREHRRPAMLGLLQSLRLAPEARFAELLLKLAEDVDDEVAEAAIMAMTRVRDRRFVSVLVMRLAMRRGRGAVREAIVAYGDDALDELQRLLVDPQTPAAIRRHIPGTLGRFGSQRAADVLCLQIGQETRGLVRYKILKALERIALHHPVEVDRKSIEEQLRLNLVEHLRMAAHADGLARRTSADSSRWATRGLLAELLQEKASQALDRSFRLLQIVHRHEDISGVVRATSSSDKKVHAQALEYLDALTLDAKVGGVRQLLGVVVDDLSVPERVRRMKTVLPAIAPDERGALAQLVQEPDRIVAAISAYYAAERGWPDLAQSARALVYSPSRAALEEKLARLLGTPGGPGLAT